MASRSITAFSSSRGEEEEAEAEDADDEAAEAA
jgi:hypothetical protein